MLTCNKTIVLPNSILKDGSVFIIGCSETFCDHPSYESWFRMPYSAQNSKRRGRHVCCGTVCAQDIINIQILEYQQNHIYPSGVCTLVKA